MDILKFLFIILGISSVLYFSKIYIRESVLREVQKAIKDLEKKHDYKYFNKLSHLDLKIELMEQALNGNCKNIHDLEKRIQTLESNVKSFPVIHYYDDSILKPEETSSSDPEEFYDDEG